MNERARAASERSDRRLRPPPGIVLLPPREPPAEVFGPWLKAIGGVVWLGGIKPQWPPFIPKSEARPLLEAATLSERAQLAGHTLALEAYRPGQRPKLYLFQGPSGRLLAEHELESSNYLFQLSPDGRRLARQVGAKAVEVTDTATGAVVARIERAGVHSNLGVGRQGNWLLLSIGRHWHAFGLNAVPLAYRPGGVASDETMVPAVAAPHIPHPGGYDPKRFRPMTVGGLPLLFDTAGGQVIVLHRDGRPAAHILIRRDRAAIVLPDGTRWGSPALLGGPPTPGAEEAIGRALRQAAGGGP